MENVMIVGDILTMEGFSFHAHPIARQLLNLGLLENHVPQKRAHYEKLENSIVKLILKREIYKIPDGKTPPTDLFILDIVMAKNGGERITDVEFLGALNKCNQYFENLIIEQLRIEYRDIYLDIESISIPLYTLEQAIEIRGVDADAFQ